MAGVRIGKTVVADNWRLGSIAALLLVLGCGCSKKAGPQWVGTASGAKVWLDCPSAPTNAIWSGTMLSGVAHGEGELAVWFKDGSVVRTNAVLRWGAMVDSMPEALSSGGTFVGAVKKGVPRGFGVLGIGGCDYVGRFRSRGSAKGEVDGYSPGGTLFYNGGFRRLAYHGRGSLLEPDGTRYEGTFKKGLKDGYGREWSPDGSRFKGYFKNGTRHGRGATTSPDGKRTWNVWRNGKTADREMVLRGRLNATGDAISPKTKERFERYLCFFELNRWWMTAVFATLVLSIFVFGCVLGPTAPRYFAEEQQKESELRHDFRRGAAFGWHKLRADRPEWFVYPALVFACFLFASKTILLFVPFPGVWLRTPTFPAAAIACLAAYAALCIYDLRFGMGYDAYRFNWKWFWDPKYDENLRTGDDEEFRITGSLRERAENVRDEAEKAKAEAEAVFAQLHRKHMEDDKTLGIIATWKEAFGHGEESKTRELFDIVKQVEQLASMVSSDGKRAADALNWFHVVFRRARNVSYEILDEARIRPVVRQAYKRDFDRIDAVTVTIESMKAEEISRFNSELRAQFPIFGSIAAGFLNLGAAEVDTFRLITGKETQLSKLRKDQDAAYESISKAVPKLGKAYAAIREAADRLDAVSEVIRQFYIHYGNVREKLLGSPSLSDYRRRRHGYKGREAVMSDDAVKSEFEQMLRFLLEMTKRFKRIDELRNLGERPNPTDTPIEEKNNHE